MDWEDVWIVTTESVILFMSVSLLGTIFFFLIKETHSSAYSLLITSRCAIRGIRMTAYPSIELSNQKMVSWGMSKESIEASATHATLDDWIAREATPFSVDSPRTFNAAVDKLIASLGDSGELLGFGEALHGGKAILVLRTSLFQSLLEPPASIRITIDS